MRKEDNEVRDRKKRGGGVEGREEGKRGAH
jgi:hypothetical protein